MQNEVFELWLLIHFIEVDETKPLPRKDVCGLLRDEFKKVEGYEDYEYDHYRIDPRTIEIVFKAGDQEKAMERAKLLLDYHAKVGNDPISANPSIKVHLLINGLLEWIKYYSYSP
ncbi:MAG: RloB domain-containing protein [Flammeovirgaceae bacterium]